MKAKANYDYRTDLSNFQVSGYQIHAHAYNGKPCGARRVAQIEGEGEITNAAYALVHRANAYPKLVEAMRKIIDGWNATDPMQTVPDSINDGRIEAAEALLRELGEET